MVRPGRSVIGSIRGRAGRAAGAGNGRIGSIRGETGGRSFDYRVDPCGMVVSGRSEVRPWVGSFDYRVDPRERRSSGGRWGGRIGSIRGGIALLGSFGYRVDPWARQSSGGRRGGRIGSIRGEPRSPVRSIIGSIRGSVGRATGAGVVISGRSEVRPGAGRSIIGSIRAGWSYRVDPR